MNQRLRTFPTPGSPLFPTAFGWLSSLMESSFGLQTAIRKALLLGDGSELPKEIWKSFNYLGLSHLLVISGSHISLFIVTLSAASRCFHTIQWRRIFIVSIVGGYCGICLPGISIARAYLCFLLWMLGGYFFPLIYRYSSLDRLGCVGILLLLVNPGWSLSPSYLLSFVATAAVLSCRSENGKGKAWALAIFPAAALLPLCHLLGFRLHPFSPIVNFIFAPLFWLVIVPASFLGLVKSAAASVENLLLATFRMVEDWARLLELMAPPQNPSKLFSFAALVLFFLGILEIESFRKRLLFITALIVSYQLVLFSDKLYFDI